MATHASAIKRAKQALVARTRNRQNMSTMKSTIKKLQEAITRKETASVDKLFVEAQSVIARTRRKGTIHANNAARRISRLAKAINKFKAGVSVQST